MSKEVVVGPDPVEDPELERRRTRERLDALKAREAAHQRARELLATVEAATRDADSPERDEVRWAPPSTTHASVALPWKLIAVVLLLAGAGIASWMFYPEPAPAPLTAADFSRIDGVRRVIARPPDVYLTVAVGEWNGLPERARSELVEQAVRAAEPAGYQSLHVLTDDGRLAAQWLEGSPVRLF